MTRRKHGKFTYDYTCTDTKVMVFLNHELVGVAGVKNPKDFDEDVLFNFAVGCTGKNLEGNV